jgi:hypothetical protein
MNIVLEYKDGHKEVYKSTNSLRGLRRNGQRPVTAYIPEDLDTETRVNIATILHPSTGHVKPLHTTLDKYIELGDRLEPLLKNEATGETMVRKDGVTYVYNELLDGTTLDKDSALDKYPEYFI